MRLADYTTAAPQPPAPRWATLTEAADYWRVSERTVRRMIASGWIDAERFGKRLIRVNLNSAPGTDRALPAYRGGNR